MASDGATHNGMTLVTTEKKAGSTVRVWIDARGKGPCTAAERCEGGEIFPRLLCSEGVWLTTSPRVDGDVTVDQRSVSGGPS